jgi:hypothetical protein
MDRNRTDRIGVGDLAYSEDLEKSGGWIPLASRRSGFEKVRAGIFNHSRGAILITGEGGAGKTWLWTQVVESLPSSWRTVSVDLTSGLGPAEFLLLVGHGLGLEVSPGLAAARLQVAAALRDEAADGRSWILIVDDADHASAEVWEEVRVLTNHLGRPDGFTSLVIVAQTGLVRRLSGREFASIASRIADHVHLPPLDLDECRALLQQSTDVHHGREASSAIEEIQRDARGNCGGVLRLARRRAGRIAVGTDPVPAMRANDPDPWSHSVPTEPGGTERAATTRTSPPPGVSLVPSRPPLRLEEGLIEVGWGGESASPSDRADIDEPERLSPSGGWAESDPGLSIPNDRAGSAEGSIVESPSTQRNADEPAEEWLEDPYAALQAWSEWARNRERAAEQRPGPVELEGGEESALETMPTGPDAGATIRAEAQHDFSPYGRLFGEPRKSKQA